MPMPKANVNVNVNISNYACENLFWLAKKDKVNGRTWSSRDTQMHSASSSVSVGSFQAYRAVARSKDNRSVGGALLGGISIRLISSLRNKRQTVPVQKTFSPSSKGTTSKLTTCASNSATVPPGSSRAKGGRSLSSGASPSNYPARQGIALRIRAASTVPTLQIASIDRTLPEGTLMGRCPGSDWR